MNRRAFLSSLISAPPAAHFAPDALARLEALGRPPGAAEPLGSAEEVAQDEDYWFQVQKAFTVDRSMVNFNNGGVSPAPDSVQESLARHLAVANAAPAYTMWRLQDPQRETVRTSLARLFGCDREEIAITRNASEGLQTLQFGFDLSPGDVVLTTTQDYPRMLNTFEQRVRREGLKLVKIPFPVPLTDPSELVRRFTAAMEEHRPRLILVSHVVFLTGQVLPVREIVAAARERGIPTLVDGAHSFGHLPFQQADLDCDYFATSLHKWMNAPIGTGMLFVRRERIEELWPLMAAPDTQTDDIRKFEEIGTHPVGMRLAIADAILFHEAIGAERKAARLCYLRRRWSERFADHERVRFQTSLAPGHAGGVATVGIEGIAPADLHKYFWGEHRIYTVAIRHEDVSGLRVSPSIYSTLAEVDRFGDLFEAVLRDGLPA